MRCIAQHPSTRATSRRFTIRSTISASWKLWKLTDYDKIVFLDADSLVVKPIDMLFGFPEFSGAPNVYETLADFHRLNSGVFVAEPSAGHLREAD